MQRFSRILLVAFLAVVAAATVAVRVGCPDPPTPEEWLTTLTEAIRADEKPLLAYVEALRSGAAHGGIDSLPIASRVLGVTVDDNKNVYFILRDSFVTFNVGFIARNGDAALLGDGQEPEIRFRKRLFNNWWYYKAS